MKKIKWLFVISLFAIYSCSQEEDTVISEKPVHEYNVVYIEDMDVYMYSNDGQVTTQVTSTPDVYKTTVRINPIDKRIAYSTLNGVHIVNESGTILDSITGFSLYDKFDWTPDGETLYILKDDQLHFYGEIPDIPSMIIPDELAQTNSGFEFKYASISHNGDLAYIIETYNWSNGYKSHAVVRPNDGSNDTILFKGNGFDPYNYVRFSDYQNDLIIARSDYVNEHELDYLYIYHNFRESATYEYTSYDCREPNYHRERDRILMIEESNYSYHLTAIGVIDFANERIRTLSSSSFSIDWD